MEKVRHNLTKLVPLDSTLKNLQFFSEIINNKFFFYKSNKIAQKELNSFEDQFRRILFFGSDMKLED
jgi:hypothetical protein